MSKIQEMTPIRPDMQPEEASDAIAKFLHENLRQDKMMKPGAHTSNTDKNKMQRITRVGGQDWVQGDRGIQRFLGAEYLEKQLQKLQPDLQKKWVVAETRFALKDPTKSSITCTIVEHKGMLFIESDDIVSYSLHLGNDKLRNKEQAMSVAKMEERKIRFASDLGDLLSPEQEKSLEHDKKMIRDDTGYADFGSNANLRKLKDGIIGIIDTEYGSFSTLSEDEMVIAFATQNKTPQSHPLIGQKFEFELKDIFEEQSKLPLTQQHDTSTIIPEGMKPKLDQLAQSVVGIIKEVAPHDTPQHTVSSPPASTIIPETMKPELDQLTAKVTKERSPNDIREAIRRNAEEQARQQQARQQKLNSRFSSGHG